MVPRQLEQVVVAEVLPVVCCVCEVALVVLVVAVAMPVQAQAQVQVLQRVCDLGIAAAVFVDPR